MVKEKVLKPQGPACKIYTPKKQLMIDEGEECADCGMHWSSHGLVPVGLGKMLNPNTYGMPCH